MRPSSTWELFVVTDHRGSYPVASATIVWPDLRFSGFVWSAGSAGLGGFVEFGSHFLTCTSRQFANTRDVFVHGVCCRHVFQLVNRPSAFRQGQRIGDAGEIATLTCDKVP